MSESQDSPPTANNTPTEVTNEAQEGQAVPEHEQRGLTQKI